MKKAILTPICVIFVIFVFFIAGCFQIKNLVSFAASEQNKSDITFVYNDRVFNYSLNKNKKTHAQFNLNYEINKYKRFGTEDERKNLFKKMLNLNFDKDVAINYIFPNLDKLIEKIEKNVYILPQNAKILTNSNSEQVFSITPEVVGQKLNRQALYDNIANNFLLNKPMVFNLPIIKLQPQIKQLVFLNCTNLRADFSTDISSSSADRKHNIKNALASLNKLEILPSETFSFNKTVGRRTKENGYRQAKIIVNNEFVEGVGGGVCQVSTTLYNAALLAGLNIVEANKHSKQVSYVKYGFDAMVNFGSSDLKFKNNTQEKLTIITNFSSSKIRIRIFGEKPNASYKLVNEIVSLTEPKEEILIDKKGEYANKVNYEDEFFYLKKGVRGITIKSYREKYVNGKLVSKTLLRTDKYKAQNAIKVFGAKKRKENFAPMVFDLLEELDN